MLDNLVRMEEPGNAIVGLGSFPTPSINKQSRSATTVSLHIANRRQEQYCGPRSGSLDTFRLARKDVACRVAP
jgi:hypothetical protein